MAEGWVGICNQALLSLGANMINDFTDPTRNAKICAEAYEQARDEVLAKYEWRCATKRAVLALRSGEPADADMWAYAFELPGDCLVPLSVFPDSEFMVQADMLLSNSSEMTLRYTSRVEDPALLPPLLKRAIAMRIAANVAFSITQKVDMVRLAEGVAGAALTEAQFAEARGGGSSEAEIPTQVNESALWTEAGDE